MLRSRSKDARERGLRYWGRLNFLLFFSFLSVFLWNFPFWREVQSITMGWRLWLLNLSIFLAVFTVNYVFFWLFSFSSSLLKILLCLLSFVNAIAFYFIYFYGISMTYSIVQDTINTDANEAGVFLSWHMVAFMTVFALLPICFILWVRFKKEPRFFYLRNSIIVGLVLICLSTVVEFGARIDLYLLDKKSLSALKVLPFSYIYATVFYIKRFSHGAPVHFKLDLKYTKTAPQEKRLMVLVIGESTRAKEFALYGYSRPTTPFLTSLAKDNKLLVFKRATACGTWTALALSCMFYPYGAQAYLEHPTYIPHYLQYFSRVHDAKLVWIDNSNRCYHFCESAERIARKVAIDDQCFKERHQCYDGILIGTLKDYLQKPRDARSTLLILHEYGAHGPVYIDRYPKKFRVFKPVCMSSNLQSCSHQAIVNAYDNAIVYTDYVLDQIIKLVRAQKGVVSSVLFLSDHGESLGEGGVYVHSAPLNAAPKEQLRVPLLLWMSPEAREHYETSCIKAKTDLPQTDDVVMNSVLGFFGMTSKTYKPKDDIFSHCALPSHASPSKDVQ